MTATAERADVLLVGNPNSGKSLLFTRLTGIAQKVANYPGVTVEVRSGHAGALTIHDYPGIYSLEPLTLDERVAIEKLDAALGDPGTRAIVCVLDATRLERSLYLLLELLPRARKAHVPVIAAVNILDEVVGAGAHIDLPGLTAAVGCPCIGVSAKTGQGLDLLRAALAHPEEMAAPAGELDAGHHRRGLEADRPPAQSCPRPAGRRPPPEPGAAGPALPLHPASGSRCSSW